MKSYSVYRMSDGQILGHLHTAQEHAELNTPDGCALKEGILDHLSQRVDANGEIVDWKPPQPTGNHVWNADSRRWEVSAEVAAREVRRTQMLNRIAVLETNSMRAMREMQLGYDGALKRLKAIDEEIAALRAMIWDSR